MGWRGAVRSIITAERRTQREAARQRRLQEKHQRIAEKHLAIQQAYNEAEAHENHLRWLVSIHKDYPELWDWSRVKELSPPKQPLKETPHEDAARTRLNNYFPGLKDRVFGKANETRERLTAELVEAYEKDAEAYEKIIEEHKQSAADWTRLVLVAEDVLEKRPAAYVEAIEIASNLLELVDLGKYLQFTIDQHNPNYIEAVLYLHGEDRIPKQIKSVLKSGKLSEKKMPVSQYNELYQDHICSCILRLASEIFAFLPVDFAVVHARAVMLNTQTGENEWATVASVAFNRKTLESINLDAVDPSDSLKNFVNNIKFLKTRGLSSVEEITPEQIGIKSGSKITGELMTIEGSAEDSVKSQLQAPFLQTSERDGSVSFGAIIAAILGFPIVTVLGYFVPTIGILAALLGTLIAVLTMVDRSMQRKRFSYLAAASLIGFLLMGYIGLTGYEAKQQAKLHAEEQAKLAAAEVAERKVATEKVEQFIKSAKTALVENNTSQAKEYLQNAYELNTPSAVDAKFLLDDLKKIESGIAAREILIKLSDSDYLSFKRKRILPQKQYFKDQYINSVFVSSLAKIDLHPIEKERSTLKELKKKQEQAALGYDTVVTGKSYQPRKEQSYTVYVTRTGSKYHRAGCRYLKSMIPMSLKEAKNAGYSACSVCRP